tara:strand:- start:3641 stop:3787 length:147 start_codon:yes stop_codon:yes gene_type:complete
MNITIPQNIKPNETELSPVSSLIDLLHYKPKIFYEQITQKDKIVDQNE